MLEILKGIEMNPYYPTTTKSRSYRSQMFRLSHICRVDGCGRDTRHPSQICDECMGDEPETLTIRMAMKTASNSKNMYKMSERVPYDSMEKMGI